MIDRRYICRCGHNLTEHFLRHSHAYCGSCKCEHEFRPPAVRFPFSAGDVRALMLVVCVVPLAVGYLIGRNLP